MKKYLSLILAIVLTVALVPNVVMAAKVGDVIGYAQPTDIVATINGYQLESYNVDGYTYICVEDLRYYGFNVNYDNASRSLSVTRNGATSIDPQRANPKFWSIGSSNTKKKILYTDIVTYINGSYVPSCNINGQTIIKFNNLAAYGAVSYADYKREISLNIYNMGFNPTAMLAASLNDQKGDSNASWKTYWRAKGDVLVYVAVARSYMNSATIEYYKNNAFQSDKTWIANILRDLRAQNQPLSSAFLDTRNSDGTPVASYQAY